MRGASEFRKGWRNLLAATVGLSMGVPTYIALSSLFLRAIQTEFGWSRTVAASGLIALPITALVLPIAGWLTDRLGVRIVAGCSVVGFAGSLFWLSRLSGSPGEFYAALIALNVLGCATGPITYTRLVAGEFVEARGAALAIAQFGIAVLTALLPPLVGGVIAADGWRAGYVFVLCAALGGGLLAQLLMRPAAALARPGQATGMSVGAALRTPAFWVLGFALASISTASLGLVSQFQPVLLDRGIDVRTTTWLLSLLSISVMISRLITGRLLDLAHPARWAAGVLVIAALGALVLVAGPGGLAVTGLAILLLGFSIGAELDLMAFFCARLFGLRQYGAIYGLLSAFFYVGIAVGGISYGAIRDATGSFAAALAGTGTMLLVSATLFLVLPLTERRLRASSPVQPETATAA